MSPICSSHKSETAISLSRNVGVDDYTKTSSQHAAFAGRVFERSEKLSSSVLSLPIGPGMSNEDVSFVCEAVNKILKT